MCRRQVYLVTCLPNRVHDTCALVGEVVDLGGDGVVVHVTYEAAGELHERVGDSTVSDGVNLEEGGREGGREGERGERGEEREGRKGEGEG